jgi:hypothetical protein
MKTAINNKEALLTTLLRKNKPIWQAIKIAQNINLPNWYLGAGCVAQTVWNHFHGFEPSKNIADIDYVYFDRDLSYEKENKIIELVKSKFDNYLIPIDIKNQARVHLWYKDHFGYEIQPYSSIEEAIKTWPTTATSIGIRLENDQVHIYAPFGLDDLFNLLVRPNRVQITEDIYLSKVNKWTKYWPKLKIIAWH